MRCPQARRELALSIGGDHDPRLYSLLESHLAVCPECRAFSREMKGALDPLRSVASVPLSSLETSFSASGKDPLMGGWSLWPALRSRLSVRRVRFNDLLDTPVGWRPVAALTFACLAFFVVVFNTGHMPHQQQTVSGFDATPVLHPSAAYSLPLNRFANRVDFSNPDSISRRPMISPDLPKFDVPVIGELHPASPETLGWENHDAHTFPNRDLRRSLQDLLSE